MQPVPNPTGHFICEQCEERYDDPGDCVDCTEEALLDLRDEDVLHLLDTFDERRFRRRVAIYSLISAVVVLPFAALFAVFSISLGLKMRYTIAFYGISVVVLSGGLARVFPPKKKRPDAPAHSGRIWPWSPYHPS